jgi:hypothetical protein
VKVYETGNGGERTLPDAFKKIADSACQVMILDMKNIVVEEKQALASIIPIAALFCSKLTPAGRF